MNNLLIDAQDWMTIIICLKDAAKNCTCESRRFVQNNHLQLSQTIAVKSINVLITRSKVKLLHQVENWYRRNCVLTLEQRLGFLTAESSLHFQRSYSRCSHTLHRLIKEKKIRNRKRRRTMNANFYLSDFILKLEKLFVFEVDKEHLKKKKKKKNRPKCRSAYEH